ncbi:chlorophyllase [Streptomyces sp. Babs14]|uniref:alpha/beta hydrolase family protein n=1 Tax=unclassified Streptomyces TaxID=2593676 RepID=UPI001C228B93|nr:MULTISPECIES: chlorophyllase [unclassified Streptomyces]MBU8547579.1 chlorophyllase [Streptomyces sp. Osf17]MBU8554347.1 chlorophyllase [Streptomyces sp. Babs14]
MTAYPATGLTGPAPTPSVSVRPVVLPAPHRGDDLHVRVSAPVTGTELPIVLFAHGFGSHLDGYAPLIDHWASHGFVVLQATHLDSRRLGLAADDPRRSQLWHHRVRDMKTILDSLDVLESSVPGLAGRVDRGRVVAAGHSFGGQTAGILVGLRVKDTRTGTAEDLSDPRVMASVQLATAGEGGEDLTPFALENAPWLREQDFSHITAPGLVVAGAQDELPLSTRGPSWTTDPYTLARGDKSLLTVYGGQHSLGGIAGYEAAETTDENPERVALVQQVTLAYLRHVTGVDDTDWETARAALAGDTHPLGRLESKRAV